MILGVALRRPKEITLLGSDVEYPDLSPYEYLRSPLPMSCVGWLGPERGVPGYNEPALASTDLERLRAVSLRVTSRTLGYHWCVFCPEGSEFKGNGEYHYYIPTGETYSAPIMILHYIEAHGYRPPDVFLEHVNAMGELPWDWRARRLAEVITNRSEDLVLRGKAIVELTNWEGSRALDVLLHAIEDEDLSNVVGYEIGEALAPFLDRDIASGLRIEGFPECVRLGIEDVLRR